MKMSQILPKTTFSRTLLQSKTLLISTTFVIFFTFIFFLNFPLQANPFSTFTSYFTSHNESSHYESGHYETGHNESGHYVPSLPPPSTSNHNIVQNGSSSNRCDIFDGNWVYDAGLDPIYAPGSCPYVGRSWNCYKNGRHDLGYVKYRWQPSECDIPRFDGRKLMEMIRGKTMVFIGDSLNRNMWESLLCSLAAFNISGTRFTKGDNTVPTMFYQIKEYKSNIIFVTTPFLVKQWFDLSALTTSDTPIEKLRIDTIHDNIIKYSDADYLIFNTGHWWNHGKVQNGENFFQEGDILHEKMDVGEAYKIALNTWANWLDKNVKPKKTQVYFVGYSSVHFKGGGWNTGGNCDKETEPIKDEKLLEPYPWMMSALETVISKMRTPVIYLNITRLTDYRHDAHPSKYRVGKSRPGLPQDCSHWCLPGVPDSWNQLLFASLLSPFH